MRNNAGTSAHTHGHMHDYNMCVVPAGCEASAGSPSFVCKDHCDSIGIVEFKQKCGYPNSVGTNENYYKLGCSDKFIQGCVQHGLQGKHHTMNGGIIVIPPTMGAP